MRTILYYDLNKGLRDPVIDEARRRVEHIFGPDNVRLEGFWYSSYANAADEAREGGPLSVSTPAGRFIGINQIRFMFPLPA